MLEYGKAVSKAASQDLHPHVERRVGHIPGTLRQDLPRSDEKRRDLIRRSDPMLCAFAMVREMLAQDPAYRPTRANP